MYVCKRLLQIYTLDKL